MAAFAWAGPATASVASADFPQLTNLLPIVLHDGVNPVPAMTEDGREGMIVTGLKNYITADGSYHVFLVLARNRPPDLGWSVVTTGTGPSISPEDQIDLADVPHTGEDMVGSIRFARGDVAGHPSFILLIARRGMEGPIPAASHATISLYVLQEDADVGADIFVLKGELKPSACYGNTDLALKAELGLQLPADYEGPQKVGICGAM
jgi:hypothetical protein